MCRPPYLYTPSASVCRLELDPVNVTEVQFTLERSPIVGTMVGLAVGSKVRVGFGVVVGA